MILLIVIVALAAIAGVGFMARSKPKGKSREEIESTAELARIHSIADGVEPFVEFMQPLEVIAQSKGYAPGIITAHVAQETGYGRSVINRNLFNIKAGSGWRGGAVKVKTWEHDPSNVVYAYFRAYSTYVDSLTDYVRLIREGAGGRYKNAWKSRGDPEDYFVQLAAAGYATDPVYAQNLIGRYQAVKDLLV